MYDGWNLLAELNATNNAAINSFAWGLDLSGSMQGAGGVGGLIAITSTNVGSHFVSHDGNGAVAALFSAADGTIGARYEYDPFHRLLRATGPLAFVNPFVASTKFCDWETGLLYYGYRYYDPQSGRWWSRDPIQERGGRNLLGFVQNNPSSKFDVLGKNFANQVPPRVEIELPCAPRCGREVPVSAFRGLQTQLQNRWARWSDEERDSACGPWRNPLSDPVTGLIGWDIVELFQWSAFCSSKNCGVPANKCGNTVWVMGGCHYAYAVNFPPLDGGTSESR